MSTYPRYTGLQVVGIYWPNLRYNDPSRSLQLIPVLFGSPPCLFPNVFLCHITTNWAVHSVADTEPHTAKLSQKPHTLLCYISCPLTSMSTWWIFVTNHKYICFHRIWWNNWLISIHFMMAYMALLAILVTTPLTHIPWWIKSSSTQMTRIPSPQLNLLLIWPCTKLYIFLLLISFIPLY